MTERVFAIADACAASGVSRLNLHQMIHRRRFVPTREAQKGLSREFTLRDIVHIAAIADLRSAGLSLARAVEVVGRSAEGTAGREAIHHQHGVTEISLDIAGITARVLNKLGLAHP